MRWESHGEAFQEVATPERRAIGLVTANRRTHATGHRVSTGRAQPTRSRVRQDQADMALSLAHVDHPVAPPAPTRRAGRERRPGHAPRPRVGDAFAALAGLGLGAVLGLVVTGETRGSLGAPGGWMIAAGRLAGFTGAYLMLVMVVLIARIPWLERAVGQDRLIRWHRRIGPWPILAITAHVVLITLGYAALAKVGALRQLWVFLSSYPDVLAAAVGFALLVMAGATSIKIARRHLKYETWWIVHLYFYLALALAFAHQIVTGGSFIGHPLSRAVWIAVWACTAGVVLAFRVVQPVVRNLRHQLRVSSVREEVPGVVSIICSGVGCTPLRALLEVLPLSVRVSFVVRASRVEDIVHRDELASLVAQRAGRYHEVIGPRETVRLDARSLARLVPELPECDLYVCGPGGFGTRVVASALRLGMRRDQIHEEAFAF